jgi:hypothetical protein
MTIVPVGVPQTGCAVTEAVGAAGAPSAALSVIDVPVVIQVLSAIFLTEIGYVPAAKVANELLAW